jgi:hypothetical protein
VINSGAGQDTEAGPHVGIYHPEVARYLPLQAGPTRRRAMKTCPQCGTHAQAAKFCAVCGQPLGDVLSGSPNGTAAEGGTPESVRPPVRTVHLTPEEGLRTFAEPHTEAVIRRPLRGRVPAYVSETDGLWAHVAVDNADAGWVDGRLLLPPATSADPNPSPGRVLPYVPDAGISAGPASGSDVVVGVLAGVGAVVGALVNWSSSAAFELTAFKIPLGSLFDNTSTATDPKLGYFIVGLAVLGVIASLVRNAGWLRFLCGAAIAAAPILWTIQLNRSIDSTFSGTSLADLIGPGVWVTGTAGVVLALSPLFKARRSSY